MDTKTKIKVAIVSAIVIIAIIFILMIIFVKGNNGTKKNKNIPNKANANSSSSNTSNNDDKNNNEGKTISLDDVCCLAIKDDVLVKIKDDGTSEKIKSLKNEEKIFIDYTYDSNKAYLVYTDNSQDFTKNVIYSIDLQKSNYPESLVYEANSQNYGGDLIVNGNTIYYTTVSGNLYEYNIDEEKGSELFANNTHISNGSVEISKKDNKLYFISETNEITEAYSMDLTTKEITTIIKGFTIGNDLLLYKDKYVVCNVDGQNYFYNLENENLWYIGPNSTYSNIIGAQGKILFYDNQILIYNNEEKIILFDIDGNVMNDEFYIANTNSEIDENGRVGFEFIENITMLSSNKMQIKISKGSEFAEGSEFVKCIIVNLDTNETEETQDFYSNVINIK